nr:hypothetical protein [Tanacetum cinerariifolium]
MTLKKVVFIAFAIEDEGQRNLMKGQSLNTRTPFEYIDMSVKEAYDSDWQTKVLTRIRRSDGVIFLITRNSLSSTGQQAEYRLAKSEGKKMIGIWPFSQDRTSPLFMSGTQIIPCGHQNIPDAALAFVEQSIRDVLNTYENPRCVSSLAVGADQLFAQVALTCAASLYVVIPSQQYETTFSTDQDKWQYQALLKQSTATETLNFAQPSEEAFLSAGMRVVDLSELLIAQAKQAHSPFAFIDMSVKKNWPEREWKEKCCQKIKRCHAVLVLLSNNTYHASGVRWEMRCANELGIPLVALVIGIDDYPTAPLRGCVNDAVAFGNTISTNGDGSPNFGVRLLTAIQTKAQLKAAVTELFQGPCDTALLYFSGHGLLNATGGYILAPDYRPNDEGLSMEQILILLNASQAKDKIIILDCCHSGALGSPPSTGVATAQLVEGVVILTASRDSESAVEVNGHGLFTSLLLSALQGGAADLRGHITPGSVYAYIDQALGVWEQLPADIIRKLTTYFPTPEDVFPLDPTYEDANVGIAVPEKVAVFKHLQKYQSVGLVVPVDAEFMFFAAQNSTSCRLTALGYHYWRLADETAKKGLAWFLFLNCLQSEP